MDNVIKIKTSNTDELISAVLMEKPKVKVTAHAHYKGLSTYIVTTDDIQDLFDFGKAYGIALSEAGKTEGESSHQDMEETRGKGNG